MHAIQIYSEWAIVCVRLQCATVEVSGGSIGNVTLRTGIVSAAFDLAAALYNDGT
jgi:hypothetical protein